LICLPKIPPEGRVVPVEQRRSRYSSSFLTAPEMARGLTVTPCFSNRIRLNPPIAAAYWSCIPPGIPTSVLSIKYAVSAILSLSIGFADHSQRPPRIATTSAEEDPKPEPGGQSEQVLISSGSVTPILLTAARARSPSPFKDWEWPWSDAIPVVQPMLFTCTPSSILGRREQ